MTTQDLIKHLEIYGYCIIPDAIPAAKAERMTEKILKLHTDPATAPYRNPSKTYQTLFGLMNFDDECWECAMHPQVLAISRHFLGEDCRLGECCSKPQWPGPAGTKLHRDSAKGFVRYPNLPWLINSMWMLTDFTEDNGPTGVVPFTHTSPFDKPDGLTVHSPLVKKVTGRRGSVMIFHGGLCHTATDNTTKDQVRVGLNIAYYPVWANNYREGAHEPIWPETFKRMPRELQELCKHRVGRVRSEVYECEAIEGTRKGYAA